MWAPDATGSGGGYRTDWADVGQSGYLPRWAAFWPLTQSKADQENSGSRVSNAPDYKLIVRSDLGTRMVRSDWRVLIDGEIYAIQSVARADRRRGHITMIVQEGQST